MSPVRVILNLSSKLLLGLNFHLDKYLITKLLMLYCVFLSHLTYRDISCNILNYLGKRLSDSWLEGRAKGNLMSFGIFELSTLFRLETEFFA